MLPRRDGFDRGEWPGPAVGLSLPVTPNHSRRVTCSTFNPVWEIRVGEDLKGRKYSAWEGGWEGTPQLSRARKPSGDWKGVCLGTPPGHDSSVGLEKGSVHQRKNKYSWNTCLLIQAESTGNVVTESSISRSYAPFWLCNCGQCGLSGHKRNRWWHMDELWPEGVGRWRPDY